MSLIGLMPALDQYEKTSRQADGICVCEREKEETERGGVGCLLFRRATYLLSIYFCENSHSNSQTHTHTLLPCFTVKQCPQAE